MTSFPSIIDMNLAGYSSEEDITVAGLDGLFGMTRLGLDME